MYKRTPRHGAPFTELRHNVLTRAAGPWNKDHARFQIPRRGLAGLGHVGAAAGALFAGCDRGVRTFWTMRRNAHGWRRFGQFSHGASGGVAPLLPLVPMRSFNATAMGRFFGRMMTGCTAIDSDSGTLTPLPHAKMAEPKHNTARMRSHSPWRWVPLYLDRSRGPKVARDFSARRERRVSREFRRENHRARSLTLRRKTNTTGKSIAPLRRGVGRHRVKNELQYAR